MEIWNTSSIFIISSHFHVLLTLSCTFSLPAQILIIFPDLLLHFLLFLGMDALIVAFYFLLGGKAMKNIRDCLEKSEKKEEEERQKEMKELDDERKADEETWTEEFAAAAETETRHGLQLAG